MHESLQSDPPRTSVKRRLSWTWPPVALFTGRFRDQPLAMIRSLRLWALPPDPQPAPEPSATCAEPVPNVCQPCAEPVPNDAQTVVTTEKNADGGFTPIDDTGILTAPTAPLAMGLVANPSNSPAVTPICFECDDLECVQLRPTTAQHVAALLLWLQGAGYGGRWVVSPDLEYAYRQFCKVRQWAPHPWNMVAKAVLRANGGRKSHPSRNIGWKPKRPRAYYIPTPTNRAASAPHLIQGGHTGLGRISPTGGK